MNIVFKLLLIIFFPIFIIDAVFSGLIDFCITFLTVLKEYFEFLKRP